MNSSRVRACLLLALMTCVCFAQADPPLLAREPTLSKTHIVFSYAGDLWIVAREGGEAKQLTAGAGVETDPHFSPDGALVAFTGEYDGNVDVFVVAATGGVPRRLTWHPVADAVVGWTPDGKHILFRSYRASCDSYSRYGRLFTMPLDGSFPSEVPLPMAEGGAYSPDGKRIAYNPLPEAFEAWKRYRGGLTSALWIADLADSRLEKIPRNNSNDWNPMWVGDQVYFLSDRNGPFSLFAYDTRAKQVREVVKNSGLDFKSASAGPGAIVIEQFGALLLYDLKSGKTRPVNIKLAGDLPSVRPALERVSSRIGPAGLSPTGARAIFSARGEVFTVPAEKGDVRNLTNTPGVAERYPSWSPDGKRIAYFSDESGEYALHLRAQDGKEDPEKIDLGRPPSFYFAPLWSPDSKKIAYADARLTIWCLDLEKKTPVKVDTDTYDTPDRALDPVWSPDSRWLTYAKTLKNHVRAIFVYSLEGGKSYQITDGMSDARYPAFDKDGKHLYFTASTDTGPAVAWLDMSSIHRPVTRSVYVAVLRKDLPSPLAPESDEEKPAEEKKPEVSSQKSEEKKAPTEPKSPEKVEVRIDFDNISQRILALPIPARNYVRLAAGKTGVLFVVEGAPLAGPSPGPPSPTMHKFDLKTRKVDRFLEGIASAGAVSFNGEKVLYRRGEQWFIAGTGQPPKPGEGALKLDGMEMRTDPRAEWHQMYREVWRIERDFFYDPGAHGLDLKATEKKYEPYLERIGSRADLNYLFQEMLGELSVGHLYVGGGASPEVRRVRGGLLGADYKIENGRYRFARVYSGENWNPETRAPLTQPGVNVTAGEYLLAVNGRELHASDNLYSFFEGTAGRSVVLRVGPDPGGKDAREVTVVPVENESTLRNLAWIEDNRRLVDKLSGGRLAYVYMPNTSVAGMGNFNRYYFAQVGKEGAVIDERFNGGGSVADYIIDYLKRPVLSWWTTRAGEDFTTPAAAIFGPKVMIINEMAGSGGDFMPWAFRKARIGPLIGKRTWGGLVGIFGYPPLIDGGRVTAPNLAFYNTEGQWEVENVGVPPDIEIEFDPSAWRAGRDTQLERAVEVCLELLKKSPPPRPTRPAYPNYHKAGSAQR